MNRLAKCRIMQVTKGEFGANHAKGADRSHPQKFPAGRRAKMRMKGHRPAQGGPNHVLWQGQLSAWIQLMGMVMIMVRVAIRTGGCIDLSTAWLTMIATAGLAEDDSPP